MDENLLAGIIQPADSTVIKSISNFNIKDISYEELLKTGITFGTNLIAAIAVFIIGRFVIKYTVKLMQKVMRNRHVEPSLYTFLNSLVSIALNFVLVVIIIGTLGINTSSFIALFASAGLAVGMALSGTLQNFAGGVMVLIFKPYRVGHYIEAQGFAGFVKEIQIFNTILITPDHQTIIIPNGALSTGSLKNFSTAANRRVDLNVEVAYGTRPETVREVLYAVIEQDERIIKKNGLNPTIPMISMSASSIVFQMRMWTKSADYWNVLFDTTERVYNALNEAGIEIPFQQVDVHMR